ncbi:MAG: GNAT family N-acetyltransferase [Rhodobacterales bacterium]|nr:GNAT family N-acetyltransferase [Rhodobacterales bacterium]
MRFREAGRDDLPAIVALLRDDDLGRGRKEAPLAAYQAAFDAIAASPADRLIVGVLGDRVVACAQLTPIPGLSRGGSLRAQVESVRVARDLRSAGLGAALMAQCEARACAAGCALIQLTTDRSRTAAHRFHERLGYAPSHPGRRSRFDGGRPGR